MVFVADEYLWPYWAVDVPGIDESQAAELLRYANECGMPSGGSVVDPRYFLAWALDRVSVEALAQALRAGLTTNMLSDGDTCMVVSMLEGLDEWLEYSSAYVQDDDDASDT